jgi:hypothetical protein
MTVELYFFMKHLHLHKALIIRSTIIRKVFTVIISMCEEREREREREREVIRQLHIFRDCSVFRSVGEYTDSL